MNIKTITLGLSLFISVTQGFAQALYQYPEEPEVLEMLRKWQDMKFGLLMHWGAYSQWGVVESWTLSSEDMGWNRRPQGKSYCQYVREYEELKNTFNPVNFNPDKWAVAAKDAGMKYMIFTTKHHDGFNMYDTQQSDYKITDPSVPFHSNAKADVTQEIFRSFRKEGFFTGAYFSKPDWHHKDYWASEWATPNRHVNYDTRKYPERWENFKTFVYRQIEELMIRYGKIDILWLDGGWVRSFASDAEEKKAAERNLWNQDIDMPKIAKMARSYQPGLIMVDRGAGSAYENYRTPEQAIPDKPLPHPWETCMTMADMWSYNENDNYKSAHQLIRTLIQVVSRGGNFLLNVGPSPEGDFHPTAYQRLEEIGHWMKINGESIYGTKTIAPYHEEKIVFTQKDGTIYASYLPDENETIPAVIEVHSFQPQAGSKVYLLGHDKALTWSKAGNGFSICLSKSLQKNPPCHYAWVFKFKAL
ncbi:MAG: alpha-L-fucosidase [Bacteroidales bacterium]|jgi:alpha-L-fucosidase|nr:alpha-L-fucosidase [Bacteroidales bacterium]